MGHWPAYAHLVPSHLPSYARALPSYADALPGYARGVQVRIEASTGRRQLLLLLAGLLASFLFIRFSVRMIRRGTSWWPGNVEPGGMHIHHVVFGQVMMFVGGIGAFAVRGGPVAHDVLAVVFGAGCGLVLDEFALVLHLEDVYWSEEGRQSVDAVILAVAVIGLLLVGAAPLGGLVGGPSYQRYVAAAVLLAFVVVSLLKGKVWTGLLGVMVPVLAIVGAVRLARPGSPWARWRYVARPRRMARAERREERVHRRFAQLKTRVMDAVAGAPTPAPAHGAAAGTGGAADAGGAARPPRDRPVVVEVPPSRLEVLLARALRPLREPAAAAAVWYLRIVTAADVVTGLVAPFRDRVRAAADGEYVTPFLLSPGFTGAVLAFVLSVSLRRRKRAAWILTAVLTGLYALVVAVALAAVPEARPHPVNWISLVLTVLLLAALLVSRTVFNVRGARGNVVLGLTSLVVGAAVAVGAGTLLVYATDRAPPSSWGASARYASVRVLTVSGLFGLPGVDVPGWTDLAVNLLSVALLVVVLLAFFRAPRGRARLPAADERRLRALLRVYGGQDSLGYFALRRDRAVCWSPARDAAVVYRVTGGVALAAGDPVGAPAAWPAAVGDWLATARRHAWVPAVAHAGPEATAAYRAAGLHAVPSAEEPVLTAAAGPAELPPGAGDSQAPGGAVAYARRVRADMSRAGYRVVVRRQRDVADAEWAGVVRLAEAWRGSGRGRGRRAARSRRDGRRTGPGPARLGWVRLSRVGARGVGLGRVGDRADGDCVLAECRDPRGRTCAVATCVPWGRDGLTLDLFGSDRESGPGPAQFVLAELLLSGVRRVSLNLRPPDAFAAFAPRRRARHLLYERRAELPRVLAAALTLRPARRLARRPRASSGGRAR